MYAPVDNCQPDTSTCISEVKKLFITYIDMIYRVTLIICFAKVFVDY